MSQALRGAIQLPDGTLVRGRALRDRISNGPLPDHGLFEPSWEAELNQVAATKASSRWATRRGPGRGAPAVPGSRL